MPKIKNMIEKELLIELVHKRPAIWDKHSEVYKDKRLKNAAWREICSLLKDDFKKMDEMQQFAFVKSVTRIWAQTRDSWIRTLNGKKLGIGTRPYIYHKEMLFLQNVINMSEYITKDTPKETNKDTAEIKVKVESISDEELETESEDDDVEFNEHNYSTNDEDSKTTTTEEVNIIETNVADVNLAKRRRIKEIDDRIEAFIGRRTSNVKSDEDRHLSFFKGIQPTLSKLDDDQILEFQSGVINLLQNIRKKKNSNS